MGPTVSTWALPCDGRSGHLVFDFPCHPRARTPSLFQRELSSSSAARTQQTRLCCAVATPVPWGCRSSATSWAAGRWILAMMAHRLTAAGDAIGLRPTISSPTLQSGMPPHHPVLVQAEGRARSCGARHLPVSLPRAWPSWACRCWARRAAPGPAGAGELKTVPTPPPLRGRHGKLLCRHATTGQSYHALAVIELGGKSQPACARSAAGER